MHLNSSGIGGNLGTTFINYLCYADNRCVISLSSSGMQQLLDICNKYINCYVMDLSHVLYVSREKIE